MKWSYVAEIAVIAYVVITVIISAKKGFVDRLFGLISTVAAVVLAIAFAEVALGATDGFFGLQEKCADFFEKTFAQIEGFNVDISAVGAEKALEEQNVSAIVTQMVLKSLGDTSTLPAGTTLAMLMSDATSDLFMTLLFGIVLFIVIKIVCIFLKKAFDSAAENMELVNGLNVTLGGVIGAAQSILAVSAVLAMLAVLPSAAITEFMSDTLLIRFLYEHNPLIGILGWFL